MDTKATLELFSGVVAVCLKTLNKGMPLDEARQLVLEAINQLNIPDLYQKPEEHPGGAASSQHFMSMTEITTARSLGISETLDAHEKRYRVLSRRAQSEPIIIEDPHQLKLVKIFGVSAEICNRYPTREKASVEEVAQFIKRVASDIISHGSQNKFEDAWLEGLTNEGHIGFIKNNKTYFHNNVSATPDAVQIVDKRVAQVAEFEKVPKDVFECKNRLAKRVGLAKRQNTLQMEAAGCLNGLVVISCGKRLSIHKTTKDPRQVLDLTARLAGCIDIFKNSPLLVKEVEDMLNRDPDV